MTSHCPECGKEAAEDALKEMIVQLAASVRFVRSQINQGPAERDQAAAHLAAIVKSAEQTAIDVFGTTDALLRYSDGTPTFTEQAATRTYHHRPRQTNKESK